MSRLRVAHVTPSFFSHGSVIGGGERYVDNVVSSLARFGHVEQCVFSFGAEDSLHLRQGVPVRVLRNESRSGNLMDSMSSRLPIEIAQGFDLLHVHQALTLSGAHALIAGKRLGLPVVGTDLGGGHETLLVSDGLINLFDGMLSISDFARSFLEGCYSGPQETVIGPVAVEEFVPPTTSIRRDGLLMVGRILPHKGFDRVIRSLPEGLALTVVGQPYDETYFKLLQRLATGRSVRFVTGATDADLRALYQESNVFVQASVSIDVYGSRVKKSELMGFTTIEAMCSGLPVIVANTGSLPEIVPNHLVGRVYRDEDELRGLLRLVRDGAWPNQRSGAAARSHVLNNFAAEVAGPRIRNFYTTVRNSRGLR